MRQVALAIAFAAAVPACLHGQASPADGTTNIPLTMQTVPQIFGRATPAQPRAALGTMIARLAAPPSANETCYSIRAYDFTAGDLKASDPRPSSSTDCVAASQSKIRRAARLVR